MSPAGHCSKLEIGDVPVREKFEIAAGGPGHGLMAPQGGTWQCWGDTPAACLQSPCAQSAGREAAMTQGGIYGIPHPGAGPTGHPAPEPLSPPRGVTHFRWVFSSVSLR